MIVSAVIGCGRMGAFTSESVRQFAPACWLPLSHCEAVKACPELELRGLCDADSAALERAGRAYGVDKRFTDHSELLRAIRPELLCVATRTLGRADIIEQAIIQGVRALHVEKPLCSSVQELERLSRSLAGDGTFLTLGAIRRHFRVYAFARALALSGQFGALQEIRVNMGRGTLYWVHPHSVDLVQFIAGDRQIDAVQARLSNVQHKGAVITSDPVVESASIVFSDGVAGHITQAIGADLVISCADGEIVVENDGQGVIVVAPEGDNPYPQRHVRNDVPTGGGPEGTAAALAQLCRCLGGDQEIIARNKRLKSEVLTGQRMLFAMLQSHLEASRLVALADVDPQLTIHGMTGGRYA